MIVAFIFLRYLIIRIINIGILGVIDPIEVSWYMAVGRCSFLFLAILVLNTAKSLGVQSWLDVPQSINGGAKYLRKVPESVKSENHLWFRLQLITRDLVILKMRED